MQVPDGHAKHSEWFWPIPDIDLQSRSLRIEVISNLRLFCCFCYLTPAVAGTLVCSFCSALFSQNIIVLTQVPILRETVYSMKTAKQFEIYLTFFIKHNLFYLVADISLICLVQFNNLFHYLFHYRTYCSLSYVVLNLCHT